MSSTRDLRDAVVVMSGASSGLGRSASQLFADHGARLVLAARDPESLAAVVKECEDRGATAIAVPTDITDPGQVDALAAAAVERFGRIDVWVESAAVLAAGELENQPVEDIQALIDTNVAGSAFGCRAAMRTFRSQGRGVLVVVASLLGVVPNPVVPTYVMSKFAMRGLALSLRQSVVGERDIHVCTVLPGPVDTPVFQRAANYTGRQLRAIPPATAPERIAAAVVACARRPRRQTTAGLASWAMLAGHHVLPRATEFVVAQYSARLVLRSEPAGATSGALHEPRGPEQTEGGWRVGGIRRAIGAGVGTYLGRRGS